MYRITKEILCVAMTFAGMAAPAVAHAQATLADPRGSGPLVSAVQ